MKGSSILGVITARGGSKRVPGKNIQRCAGKPLIIWTIEAARASRMLTRVIVSTEDEEIARVARGEGVEVIMRPKELALDDTPHLPVMQHALAEAERGGATYEYAVILQPTSPLRTGADIDATIQKIIEQGAESAVSLVEIEDASDPKAKRLEGERVKNARPDDSTPLYKRNGAVYVTKRATLVGGSLYGEHTVGYVMPKERSVDINTESDWNEAETLLARNG